MKGKTIALAIAATMAIGIAPAQKQKTPTQKPPAKAPAQKEPGRIILGTNQMAGDQGKFGLTYTIGQRDFVNITLTDAKFSVEPFNVGNQAASPNKNEKLLVLTYVIHNPNSEITVYHGGTLKFTAVDQEDVNHEAGNHVTQKSVNEPLNIQLKPAQKITVQTAILVPAKGTVPKLIVQHQSGGAVLRYDLREVLKPLDAPFAGEGFDAVSEIKPLAVESYVPLMNFDIKYMSNAFQERQFGVTTIGDEKVFFLPKIMLKKTTRTGHIARIYAEAVTEDGDRYPSSSLGKASVEEHANVSLEQGQENAMRIVIVVPKKAKITSVRVWEAQGKDSRTVIYPVDAQFTKSSAPAAAQTTPSAPAVTGFQADEYSTVFKDAKGADMMQATHLQLTQGSEKRTEITIGSSKAILIEDLSTGMTTLHVPATGETLGAPRATGKEPQTSLNYYSLVYANAAAPKPKKKNLLGQIAGDILGNAASGLGQSLVSGAVLSSFGLASMPAVINAGVQNHVHGYAVHSLASKLGRAVMTSEQPVNGQGPDQLQASVTVDKSVYVQTAFKGKKPVAENAFAVDSLKAKQVSATDLYKRFADFMSQGVKS